MLPPLQNLAQVSLTGTAGTDLLVASAPTEIESVRVYNAGGGGSVTLTFYLDPTGGGVFTASTTVHLVSVAASGLVVLENTSSPLFGLAAGAQLAVAADVANVAHLAVFGRVYRGTGGN